MICLWMRGGQVWRCREHSVWRRQVFRSRKFCRWVYRCGFPKLSSNSSHLILACSDSCIYLCSSRCFILQRVKKMKSIWAVKWSEVDQRHNNMKSQVIGKWLTSQFLITDDIHTSIFFPMRSAMELKMVLSCSREKNTSPNVRSVANSAEGKNCSYGCRIWLISKGNLKFSISFHYSIPPTLSSEFFSPGTFTEWNQFYFSYLQLTSLPCFFNAAWGSPMKWILQQYHTLLAHVIDYDKEWT